MPFVSCIRREASLWFGNGANLITLSRLPMLFCVQWALLGVVGILPAHLEPWLISVAIFSIWWLVVVWSNWKYLFTAVSILAVIGVQLHMPTLGWQELFLFLVVMQTVGMITDGLDGRFARKYSKLGPTPEGQFLDQFIDKVFVWVTWFTLFVLGARELNLTMVGVAYLLGLSGSLYLALLDFRSCRKHWRNYRADRGKPLNTNSGAKWQGKWKFGMENVVVCAALISFCPEITEYAAWYQYILFPFVWAGKVSIWLTLPALGVAVLLARSSLRDRGELTSRFDEVEEWLIRLLVQCGQLAKRPLSLVRG